MKAPTDHRSRVRSSIRWSINGIGLSSIGSSSSVLAAKAPVPYTLGLVVAAGFGAGSAGGGRDGCGGAARRGLGRHGRRGIASGGGVEAARRPARRRRGRRRGGGGGGAQRATSGGTKAGALSGTGGGV